MFAKYISGISSVVGLMCAFAAHSEIIHNGTVVTISDQFSSADANLSESWSWIQLSGLTAVSGCASGDEGAGDLAYLALPASERYGGSLLLSAHLAGKSVRAVIDDANLLEGNCRLKRVLLAPPAEGGQPQDAILQYDHTNLLAAYTMDNISGSALVDESGNTGGGTITGATAEPGIIGSALTFDGATDYVDLGDILDSTFVASDATFSFSFWLKMDVLGNDVNIISKTGDSNQNDTERQLKVYVTSENKIRFLWYGDVAGSIYRVVENSSTLTQGMWHHIVVSYDANISSNDGRDRVKIYFDGNDENVSLTNSAGILPDIVTSNAHLSLGAQFGATGPISGAMDGSLDALRIFDKVLDASEVNALFNEG